MKRLTPPGETMNPRGEPLSDDRPTSIQAQIDRQLEAVVAELDDQHARGRRQCFLALQASAVANLLGRPDLSARLGTVLSRFKVDDCLNGAITNLDRETVGSDAWHRPGSLEETDREHPSCDDRSLIERMNGRVDRHVQLCVQGDIDGAVQAASDDLALDDIGSTLAVLGLFDRAAAFIDLHSLGDSRRSHVRFVILLEKCRRGLPDFAQAIDQTPLDGYQRLYVALALARRVPWCGYPYSDW